MRRVKQWGEYMVGDWLYNGRRCLGRITAIETNGFAAHIFYA